MASLWHSLRTGLTDAIASRLSRRDIARARTVEPLLSWEFDFTLMEDVSGPYFADWRNRRVPPDRLRMVAADIDRLLAHIGDPEAGIPNDPGVVRNPWDGQAFEMDDPQFSGARIDVNVSRRAGTVEVDIPTGASEQPVRQTIADLERMRAAIRHMLALWEVEVDKRTAAARP